jgi:transposase
MTSTYKGEVKLIAGVERRRCWSTQEKKAILDEVCQNGASVSQIARKYGINPSQLFKWKRLMEAGALQGIASQDELVPKSVVKELEKRIADLERLVGKKSLEIEILHEAIKISQQKKQLLLRGYSKPEGSL